MKKIAIIGLVVLLAMAFLVPISEAKNQRARGIWTGVAITAGIIGLYNLAVHGNPSPVIPPNNRAYEGGRVYVGRYPALAGGNVVTVFNGLAYDIEVTEHGDVVCLGPGASADFPVFFDERTIFTAVVLDNDGNAIGTSQQSFSTNGRAKIWHITSYKRLQK